jgi:hypothetical protein
MPGTPTIVPGMSNLGIYRPEIRAGSGLSRPAGRTKDPDRSPRSVLGQTIWMPMHTLPILRGEGFDRLPGINHSTSADPEPIAAC